MHFSDLFFSFLFRVLFYYELATKIGEMVDDDGEGKQWVTKIFRNWTTEGLEGGMRFLRIVRAAPSPYNRGMGVVVGLVSAVFLGMSIQRNLQPQVTYNIASGAQITNNFNLQGSSFNFNNGKVGSDNTSSGNQSKYDVQNHQK